jgi:RNA recognition motif-containing protein
MRQSQVVSYHFLTTPHLYSTPRTPLHFAALHITQINSHTHRSCEIIRDFKTGDSLNFAFIEFETEGAAVAAYEKMDNVLVDDRRIKVRLLSVVV